MKLQPIVFRIEVIGYITNRVQQNFSMRHAEGFGDLKPVVKVAERSGGSGQGARRRRIGWGMGRGCPLSHPL